MFGALVSGREELYWLLQRALHSYLLLGRSALVIGEQKRNLKFHMIPLRLMVLEKIWEYFV